MYKNILLAIDGSKNSMRAADEAIKLAKTTKKSNVTVLLVAEYSKAKEDILHAAGSDDADLARKRVVLPVVENLKKLSIDYEVEMLHGEAGPVIVEHANSGDYDVVVIGGSGSSMIQDIVLGSVSREVIKRANCPVLVVK